MVQAAPGSSTAQKHASRQKLQPHLGLKAHVQSLVVSTVHALSNAQHQRCEIVTDASRQEKGAQILKSIRKRLYTLAACGVYLTSTPWGLMMPRRPPVGLKYILQTAMLEVERRLPACTSPTSKSAAGYGVHYAAVCATDLKGLPAPTPARANWCGCAQVQCSASGRAASAACCAMCLQWQVL